MRDNIDIQHLLSRIGANFCRKGVQKIAKILHLHSQNHTPSWNTQTACYNLSYQQHLTKRLKQTEFQRIKNRQKVENLFELCLGFVSMTLFINLCFTPLNLFNILLEDKYNKKYSRTQIIQNGTFAQSWDTSFSTNCDETILKSAIAVNRFAFVLFLEKNPKYSEIDKRT